jgi:hypothetical protein
LVVEKLTPNSEAAALIEVSMQSDSILGSGSKAEEEFKVFKGTQAVLIRSPFVLRAALRRPEIGSLRMLKGAGDEPEKWLKDHLKVTFPAGGEVMRVSLSGDDRAEAAKLVNAVVQAYLQEVVDRDLGSRAAKLVKLRKALAVKDSEIRKQQRLLEQRVDELGTADPNVLKWRGQVLLQELALYQRELLSRNLKLIDAQAKLKAIEPMVENARQTQSSDKSEKLAESQRKLKLDVVGLTAQVKFLDREVDRRKRDMEGFGRSSVEVEMVTLSIDKLKTVRSEIAKKYERMKVELEARPRVRLIQGAAGK